MYASGVFDDGTRAVRVALIIVTLSVGWPAVSIAQQAAAPQCQASGPLVRIPELPEASGVAVSRRSPGRLWSHRRPISSNAWASLARRGRLPRPNGLPTAEQAEQCLPH
jgi:hypothetical protein